MHADQDLMLDMAKEVIAKDRNACQWQSLPPRSLPSNNCRRNSK